MFIVAGSGHGVVQNSELPKNEAGFISIDEYCRVIFDDEEMSKNVAFNISQLDKGEGELKILFKAYKYLVLDG